MSWTTDDEKAFWAVITEAECSLVASYVRYLKLCELNAPQPFIESALLSLGDRGATVSDARFRELMVSHVPLYQRRDIAWKAKQGPFQGL